MTIDTFHGAGSNAKSTRRMHTRTVGSKYQLYHIKDGVAKVEYWIRIAIVGMITVTS
jgi:hypothetical protein